MLATLMNIRHLSKSQYERTRFEPCAVVHNLISNDLERRE